VDANGLDHLRPPHWVLTVVASISAQAFDARCSHPRFPVDLEASFAAVAGTTTDLLKRARAPVGYEPAWATLTLRLTAFGGTLLMFES
jgi:hypothetical protein